MTKMQRAGRVLTGLLMIAGGIVVLKFREWGLEIIAILLSLTLMANAVRYLIYYFTMARFMVGGKTILMLGVILLDFSICTSAVVDKPRLYVIPYLIACHAVSGAISLVKGSGERRDHVPGWGMTMLEGTVNLLITAAAVLCIRSVRMLELLYCAGLFYSAAMRILSAFRRTAIVYIP